MFRRLSRPLLVCLLVLCAGTARLTADLAADLARISVEAAGGAAAHEALRGLRAVGVTRVGEREASFILYAERPARLRVESLGPNGSLVRAGDGVHAPWRKDAPRSPPRRLGREEEREFLFDADFDQPLHDFARRGISLDFAGDAVIDGRRVQKILAVVRFTEVVTLYIDEETRLLVRRDQTRRVRGRETVIETHYSDFRPLAGVVLPWRVKTVADGRVLTETIIETMDANPPLPAGFFAPPAADWPKL